MEVLWRHKKGGSIPPSPPKSNSYGKDESVSSHSKCEVKKSVPEQAAKKGLGSEDVCKMGEP
jgi:hypothetical protein